MPLTTAANVKEYLGITASTDDTLIGKLITRAQEAIERHCNRKFDAATYTDDVDGGGRSLQVYNPPIRTLTSVAYVTRSGTITLDNDLFTVNADAGILTLDADSPWPYFDSQWSSDHELQTTTVTGVRNYQIVYAGGFVTVPGDLEQVCIEVVKAMYLQRRINLDMGTENIGGGASFTHRSVQEVFDRNRQLLAPFVRVDL